MKFNNSLTQLLGIRFPIIQGAYGWKGIGNSSIAAAVSDAGGLGILTTISYESPEKFAEDVEKIKNQTTNPFGINYTLLYGTEFFNADFHKDYLEIAIDNSVKIGFTSAYDGSAIGKIIKDAGGIWIHKCASIKHAVSIAKKGADAVILVGLEGAGYKSPNQNTTLINITAARRLISVPIIAAGGIADARGLAGALAMGAAGVYLGTAFMATDEFLGSQELKNRIIRQDVSDPAFYKRVFSQDKDSHRPPSKPVPDFYSMAASLITRQTTVQDLINDMVLEAKQIMMGLNSSWIDDV